MFWVHYLDKSEFFIAVGIKGSVDVWRDSKKFRITMVQLKAGITPDFIT